MFANDKNIDNLQQLLAELKKYAELQKDYVKLHLVEKLTILISTLILVFILLILGIIALFYLSFTLAYVLAPHVGGLMASYGIITGCIILLILLIVLFRKRLIVQPMVNFLANLLLNDNTPNETPIITLEVIAQRKAEKLEEVQQAKKEMVQTIHELFAPVEHKGGVEGIMQHINTGIAVYDGVRTGIKIMQRIRGYFLKKKK